MGAKALHSDPLFGRAARRFCASRWTRGADRRSKSRSGPIVRKGSANDQVESVLAEWWQELLGLEHVGLDDDFFELGGHSLIVVRLFSKIKKTYGIDLGLSTLFEARTVRKLAQLIREASAKRQLPEPSRSRAIVADSTQGNTAPLFVISGLGGNVIKFHSMAFYLGEDQPVYGLCLVVSTDANRTIPRVEDMAAYYVEAIRKCCRKVPIAWWATLRRNRRVRGGTATRRSRRRCELAGDVRYDRVALPGSRQKVARFARHSRRLPLQVEARRAGKETSSHRSADGSVGSSPSASPPSTTCWVASCKLPREAIEDVNVRAGASYWPSFYRGKLTLFRSTSREPWDGDDEFLGWGGLVGGGIEVHHVPSSHYTILQEPGVRILSEKLRHCLDREPALPMMQLQLEPALGHSQ